jgi:hypothetical protein
MVGIGMASGRALAVSHVQVVALYDRKSGAIKHVHTVTTFGNGTPMNEADAVAEARRHAAARIKGADRLAVAVSNEAQHAEFPHRVDPKTRRFVRLELKKVKRR